MALGKLWNALFGKRAAVVEALPIGSAATPSGQPTSEPVPASRRSTLTASDRPLADSAPGQVALSVGCPTASKIKKKSAGKRERKSTAAPLVVVAPVVEAAPQRSIRIAHPQKNAWTKLISGRPIGCILDTQIGDASRAAEVLAAIVCDAVPTPKYIAIDLFELGSGPLSVVDFHQRIRRAGGQPVAIPADLPSGLRQLSQTLGSVDLVLLDGAAIDLTQLELRRLLGRVTHSDSLVLQQDQRGKWQRIETLGAARPRAGESSARAA